MRIIAIETTGRHGSVAALEGNGGDARLLRQAVLTGGERTAQALAPAMQNLLREVAWSPRDIELVAVAVGPGSFTGLRIGLTTAKTFAYAVGANIIGVNTLAALADQALPHVPPRTPLWTILDAQRQELFAARFESLGDGTTAECDVAIVGREKWLALLQSGDRVIGPPLKTLAAQLPPGVAALPEDMWLPMAHAVGRVGWRAFQSGRRDDVWQLAPQYYRASAAEEKANRAGASSPAPIDSAQRPTS